MAAVKDYERIVRKLILEHATHRPKHGDIELRAVIDAKQGLYQVQQIGWQNRRRVHGTSVHIDLIGDKVWVQHDGTRDGVANELVEAGIPRENIVLGFRPAHVRPSTGFAVG